MRVSQIETLTNIVRELGEAKVDQVWAECDEIYTQAQVRDGLQNARKVGKLVNDGRHPPNKGEKYAKPTTYRAVEPKAQPVAVVRPANSVFALGEQRFRAKAELLALAGRAI